MKTAITIVMTLVLAIFVVTPASAMFTDNLETKPFRKTGKQIHPGDVNDFEWGGRKGSNDFSKKDINPGLDDTLSVQTGADKESLYDSFEAASSDGRFTSTDSSQAAKLDAGQTHWPRFKAPATSPQLDNIRIEKIPSGTIFGDREFRENLLCHRMPPIDDDSGDCANSPVIPAPGAILLGGIGVSMVGWLRMRKTL